MCGGFVGNTLGLKRETPATVQADPVGDARRAEAEAAIRANRERLARSQRRRSQSLLATYGSGGDGQSVLSQYGKDTLG